MIDKPRARIPFEIIAIHSNWEKEAFGHSELHHDLQTMIREYQSLLELNKELVACLDQSSMVLKAIRINTRDFTQQAVLSEHLQENYKTLAKARAQMGEK